MEWRITAGSARAGFGTSLSEDMGCEVREVEWWTGAGMGLVLTSHGGGMAGEKLQVWCRGSCANEGGGGVRVGRSA